MVRAKWGALVVVLALCGARVAHAAWIERSESVSSRTGVSVSYLLATAVPSQSLELGRVGELVVSADSGEKNKLTPLPTTDVVVFFPGAEGRVRAARSGKSEHNAQGRPSSMGLMAERFGVAVAVGLPSDQADGISTAWRTSDAHLVDALAVIDSVSKAFPQARLTLVGMSNGGRSVTHVASALVARGTPNLKLSAVVVMSSMPEAINAAVMKPIVEAKVPVLVMHHKRDSCLPYRFMAQAASSASPPLTFVATDDPNAPTVSPLNRQCGPGSPHVFGGREEWAFGGAAAWAKTGKLPPG
jgi:hypothetical protein